MLKRTLIFFGAAFLFAGFFSFGSNRVLDNVAIVNSIVFDTDAKTNQMCLYFIAYDSTAEPKESVGKYTVLKGTGKSIVSCIDSAQRACGKTMFLGHIRMVIMEKSFAKKSHYVREFYDFAVRDSYFNFYCTVYILEDEKNSFVGMMEEDDTASTLFFDNAVKKSPIKEYYSAALNEILNCGSDYALPFLKVDKTLYFSGIAVMRDDSFAFGLNEEEANYFRLLKETTYSLNVSTPQGEFLLNETKVKLKCSESGSRIRMNYKVDAVCEVITLNREEVEQVNTDSMKADIADFMDEKLTALSEKFLLMDVDALESVLKIKRLAPNLAKKFKDDEALFKAVDYDITVNIVVVRNGVMY